MAGQRVEAEASSGDISIRAIHGDDGYRTWQVSQGGEHRYSYTSNAGLKDPSQPDNLSNGNFNRTDGTMFELDGTGDTFYRSAPDYGNAPASGEFTKGLDTVSAKHEELQAKLAENSDYIKAVEEIKEKLGEERSATFFNKPSNDLIHEDATKGMDRAVPSSIYWTDELDNMDGNLMNPSSDASNDQNLNQDAPAQSSPETAPVELKKSFDDVRGEIKSPNATQEVTANASPQLDEMNFAGSDASYSGDAALGQEVAQLMEVSPEAVPAPMDSNAMAPVEQTNDMNFAV